MYFAVPIADPTLVTCSQFKGAAAGLSPPARNISAAIEHLGATLVGDKDVFRLDIPVYDALGVSGFQGVGNFGSQRENRFRRQRLPGDFVLQRCAVQVLHHNERAPILLADIVNRAGGSTGAPVNIVVQ